MAGRRGHFPGYRRRASPRARRWCRGEFGHRGDSSLCSESAGEGRGDHRLAHHWHGVQGVVETRGESDHQQGCAKLDLGGRAIQVLRSKGPLEGDQQTVVLPIQWHAYATFGMADRHTVELGMGDAATTSRGVIHLNPVLTRTQG